MELHAYKYCFNVLTARTFFPICIFYHLEEKLPKGQLTLKNDCC